MSRIAAVVLAAGEGTRMKSSLPKVLHPLVGQPMVWWPVHNLQSLGVNPIVVVVGVGAEQVRSAIGESVLYATQAERLGTGHAALQAREHLLGVADVVLVLYGDMPTLRAETLERLISLHLERKPALAMLTVESEDSMGFGRVVRDAQGNVQAVVEEAVATPDVLALKELNCGVYAFDTAWLWESLPKLSVTQPAGEYYLTDMVGLAVAQGQPLEALTIKDVAEVQGVNDRVQLARSERILRERILERLMLDGVTIVDPAATYVEPSVKVGRDTTIHPNTHLQGHTVVGERCVLGPNSIIRDTQVGDDCVVLSSVLEEALVEDHVQIGPFGHLRPGAHLGEGVHMGNFGEVKNSYLGPGVRMGHFSYIGDAEVGADVNIGAGTITCNYDGVRKHRTSIGEGAFIGSGTMLVAPVSVGAHAVIGAGSVVTRDVPARTVAYGVPARHIRKLDDACEADEEKGE
ncbi:MAG: UDP-N-acetylglucosamine diphosphorylase/glucosamine-1-phosphate N-acetyltransferase [Chloroflexi bacterium RBG_13_56_8]|nr:MAG: UDP-N-acetylglucosamine diphosphorylase/glucosamine-1-phosphate N-acetyltransferase [Chloroflexi bacterium RBG_13_56_8]